jgi:enamine deaminase RidA (YjgF/YER057c/UK114 family)
LCSRRRPLRSPTTSPSCAPAICSGQICLDDGKLVAKGQLGAGISVEDGQKAARACAINLLAQVKAAVGDLDKVARVVRLGGFVNSAPGFLGPKVMNGASDVMSPSSARRASTRARPSASQRCRSMRRSRSRPCSKCPERWRQRPSG